MAPTPPTWTRYQVAFDAFQDEAYLERVEGGALYRLKDSDEVYLCAAVDPWKAEMAERLKLFDGNARSFAKAADEEKARADAAEAKLASVRRQVEAQIVEWRNDPITKGLDNPFFLQGNVLLNCADALARLLETLAWTK